MATEHDEKDKAVREEEPNNDQSGKEVPQQQVEGQDDPEPEGGKASGQSGLNT